jgi:hypothetical protein
MTDHVNMMYLILGLAVAVGFKFVLLSFFLWVMIKIQGLQYELLPVIGAAFLAASLDMIPLGGHYIAVPVLYLCIWKITRTSLYPEAVFTVVISYALMFTTTLILLAYAPVSSLHTASEHNYNFDDQTNIPAIAVVQTTNQIPVTQAPPPPSVSKDKIAANISVTGVSHVGNDAIVTIQYGKKSYVISLGEGTTISTDQGMTAVHFVKATDKDVTLSIKGKEVKYALK